MCAFYKLILKVLIKEVILIAFVYVKSKKFQKGIDKVLQAIPKKTTHGTENMSCFLRGRHDNGATDNRLVAGVSIHHIIAI